MQIRVLSHAQGMREKREVHSSVGAGTRPGRAVPLKKLFLVARTFYRRERLVFGELWPESQWCLNARVGAWSRDFWLIH